LNGQGPGLPEKRLDFSGNVHGRFSRA
jgi:hypothetical protein